MTLCNDAGLLAKALESPAAEGRQDKIGRLDDGRGADQNPVEEGCTVLGMRFTEDRGCPPERFAALRRELGSGFEAIEIDSSPGNPWGIKSSAHSVVTADLVDEAGHPTRAALDRVLALFKERLLGGANAGS